MSETALITGASSRIAASKRAVTVLAPGYVKAAFADRTDLHGTILAAGGGKMPASVAKCGYDAMSRSELIAINEKPLAFMLNWLIPFLPRRAQDDQAHAKKMTTF
ncbi:hypothetical protein [Sulfitobacter sp.]|uniref:hypothetical protein n=1 Tax=Sulfitobacter sp. TaxID=1903071 RepID=UPI003EFABAE1